MTSKKYFFYIVLTIPSDMIKNFILKAFKVRKIHYERKLALFLKKSDMGMGSGELKNIVLTHSCNLDPNQTPL